MKIGDYLNALLKGKRVKESWRDKVYTILEIVQTDDEHHGLAVNFQYDGETKVYTDSLRFLFNDNFAESRDSSSKLEQTVQTPTEIKPPWSEGEDQEMN